MQCASAANARTTQRRWIPAFSFRTLLIVMAVLCAYAACWWPTKTQGREDVKGCVASAWESGETSAVAPLLVYNREKAAWDTHGKRLDWPTNEIEWEYFDANGIGYAHCCYFWFFGFVAKLPFEHQEEIENVDGGHTPSEYWLELP